MGKISQYTRHTRTLRAISWLYWTEVQDCYHVSFPTEFRCSYISKGGILKVNYLAGLIFNGFPDLTPFSPFLISDTIVSIDSPRRKPVGIASR